ncbi:DUF6036 family nucleotidyltransferase [Paenarthrobacter sp. NPDC058040]|uniref:DUF6036 family nucleotidyltransferase n=1 Tax=unclassified Paenarthrobacter TaxID=2634190 RepID=UPI0036DCEFFD
MSRAALDASLIRVLLQELADRLESKGIAGDIRLVGGAALILQGISVRMTTDIDASYAEAEAVDLVVSEMARDYGLEKDWLNSHSSAFVPDGATWVALEPLGALKVHAADTRTLLAMKIAAEREKDIPDIARLLANLGISSPEEAVDLAYEKYGEHAIPLAAGRDNYLIVVEEAMAATPLLPGADASPPAVWVAPHTRHGRLVRGHYRRRPDGDVPVGEL